MKAFATLPLYLLAITSLSAQALTCEIHDIKAEVEFPGEKPVISREFQTYESPLPFIIGSAMEDDRYHTVGDETYMGSVKVSEHVLSVTPLPHLYYVTFKVSQATPDTLTWITSNNTNEPTNAVVELIRQSAAEEKSRHHWHVNTKIPYTEDLTKPFIYTKSFIGGPRVTIRSVCTMKTDIKAIKEAKKAMDALSDTRAINNISAETKAIKEASNVK